METWATCLFKAAISNAIVNLSWQSKGSAIQNAYANGTTLRASAELERFGQRTVRGLLVYGGTYVFLTRPNAVVETDPSEGYADDHDYGRRGVMYWMQCADGDLRALTGAPPYPDAF